MEFEGKQFNDPFDKQSILGKFWADTFSFKSVNVPLAKTYLSFFPSDFSFDSLTPTTSMSVAHYVRYTHAAKTGPNGVPNSVYFSGGPPAFALLALSSQRAQAGLGFSYGFNDSEAVFPPKGKKTS